MLDELLGRAALKEEVSALEDQVERLEDQLSAARERRRAAVRDRQTAEERCNRLEDRIADLEGQLERARDGEVALDFRGTEALRGDRLDAVLDRLRSVDAGPEGAFSAMVADRAPGAARDAFGERAALLDRAAPCVAYADDAGLVSAALAPPLPPDPFTEWGEGFRVEPAWFGPTGPYAIALVRSDLFAYGEFDGDEPVLEAGFESDVMGDHSKGGFSQARFERRRDDQIEAHLDRCRDAIADRDPDRLYVVGERSVIGRIADADATAAVDATGDPETALRDAVRAFWTTTLYRI